MKDIEVIELTETLKAGNEVYNKGLVLDRKNGPFPSVIVVEIAAVRAGKSRALKILRTRADVKKEEQQVRDIENAKHEAEATVKKQRETIASLEQKVQLANDLEVVVREIEIKLEKLNEKVSFLENQNADLASAVEVAEKEIVRLTTDNSDLKQENTGFAKDCDRLRRENIGLADAVRKAKK